MSYTKGVLPVFFTDWDFIHVNTVNKPSPFTIPVRPEKQIITAHHALAHLSRFSVKGPILQPIAPLPTHPVRCVLVLVPELHGDAIIAERKEFLAKAIVVLSLPFGCQKLNNILGAREERGSVTPDARRSISLRDAGRVSFPWLVSDSITTSFPCNRSEAHCSSTQKR